MSARAVDVVFMDRSSRIGLTALPALLAALALAPFWATARYLQLLVQIYAYVALASAWNLLAGYAGLVSVGQQAYVGLGGYLLFALTMFAGVPPLWAIPLVGVIAAVVSMPVAALVFRLRGHYFAIGTWVVAEVFRLLAVAGVGARRRLGHEPAGQHRALDRVEPRHGAITLIYWVALALAVLVLALIVVLLRSRYGLALTAIRDNEIAAQSQRRRRRARSSASSM